MAVRVPFLDLTAAFAELAPELRARVDAVLSGGRYVQGAECEAFEREFAAYAGAGHCVGVGNGLDALRLSLTALGIGTGDDVLVPSHTYVATWLAVSAVGARPVPVEPDEETFTVSAPAFEAALTPATRAMVPVHLYGLPADMGPILELAADRGLRVLADAAQAHGARYRDRPVGGLGDLVAWSFYPGKNLGAFGDGGAVTGDDPALVARVRRLANYGSTTKYEHPEKGWNSRLDEVQAAVLRVKLGVLDEWNARRSSVAGRYQAEIRHPAVALPAVPAWAQTAWHQFVVRTPARDRLAEHLREQGVDTLVHYPVPPHRQGAYAELAGCSLPVAERLAAEVLSLPIGPHLSAEQVDAVVCAVSGASLP